MSAAGRDPLAYILPIIPDALDFDPDEVARRFGDAHLIPPAVRRLSSAEIRKMFPKAVAPAVAPSAGVTARSRPHRGLGGIDP